ncbi:MAG: sarcosine oxidase subunit gamma family protein [Anaerolineae bacterium]|nr:sarcosine oxidase subunit gamma family protein [Anaerolineae bacterium]
MAALPFVSPFSTGSDGAASTGVASAVRLDDLTAGLALLHLQGRGALDVLAEVFGDSPRTPGAVSERGAVLLAALRPDIAAVFVPAAESEAVAARLAAAAASRVTLLDVSHGRGIIALSGPHAAAVLSRLCGLDFREPALPNQHAAQTSLAKVRALIVRAGEGAAARYLLAVNRSHGAYVWAALAGAMEEFLEGR